MIASQAKQIQLREINLIYCTSNQRRVMTNKGILKYLSPTPPSFLGSASLPDSIPPPPPAHAAAQRVGNGGHGQSDVQSIQRFLKFLC